jgi:hypothetical protein
MAVPTAPVAAGSLGGFGLSHPLAYGSLSTPSAISRATS